jgi:hypothetical protein
MSAGSNVSLVPKMCSSGLNVIRVPVPLAEPTALTLVLASPRSKRCSHFWPSRRTTTSRLSDSALTTAEPTPWRPPDTA